MDIDLRTLERIQELTNKVESLKITASKTIRKTPKTRKKKDDAESVKPSSDSKRF